MIVDVIAERESSAHEHALLLGGRDFVADTLAGDFAFKLGEGQKNVQG